MPRAVCPVCRLTLRFPAERAATRAQCPGCGHKFRLPGIAPLAFAAPDEADQAAPRAEPFAELADLAAGGTTNLARRPSNAGPTRLLIGGLAATVVLMAGTIAWFGLGRPAVRALAPIVEDRWQRAARAYVAEEHERATIDWVGPSARLEILGAPRYGYVELLVHHATLPRHKVFNKQDPGSG